MVVCLAVLFGGQLSFAQDAGEQVEQTKRDLARERYAVGRQHYDAGRFEEAAAAYLEAYEREAIPLFLYNLGQAKRLGGDKPAALQYYKKYLELEPKGPGATNAREFVETIERELAERKLAERKLAAEKQRPAAPVVSTERDAPRNAGGGKRIAGAVLGAAGLAALGVGIKFGLDARSRDSEVSRLQGTWNPADKSIWNDGESSERNMLLLTATGLAAVTGGAALYCLGRRDAAQERDLSVTPTIGSDIKALSVVGVF